MTESRRVLGMRVDGTSYREVTERVLASIAAERWGYVCVANVHMVMEARDSGAFGRVVEGAELVTPDGMPLVWMLRGLGLAAQQRVYGPTLMLRLCEAAAAEGIPVGLYGSTTRVMGLLQDNLRRRFEGIEIPFAHSPPFRPIGDVERDEILEEIDRSGARILFVGLGCPKQELWMAENTAAVPAVMVGVGAAFDIHAGTLPQAPEAAQRLGLEWLFRLAMEPHRLSRRYLSTNPRFAARALRQLLSERLF